MNGFVKSANPKTGAVVRAFFNASNASWCSCLHTNGTGVAEFHFLPVLSAFLCWDPDSLIHTGEMPTVNNYEYNVGDILRFLRRL